MKTTNLLILLMLSLPVFSQNSNFLIKFKATEEANPWIGKNWDFSFKTLNTPLVIEFDGKVLNMYYENGKRYLKLNVLSYNKLDKSTGDKIESETYTLKTDRDGFINYIIIEKKYSFNTITEIRIPFVDKSGQTQSYWYYQDFN